MYEKESCGKGWVTTHVLNENTTWEVDPGPGPGPGPFNYNYKLSQSTT